MIWVERFWSKTRESDDGCILWTAAMQSSGYGCFAVDRRSRLAHRVAYELAWGPIPEGHQVDHLCRVRACVNPNHLDAVAPAVNNARAVPFRSGRASDGRRLSWTLRTVEHHYSDPVNGPVYSTHPDYPYLQAKCPRCQEAAA